jgi:hypothetical protein
MQTTKITNHYRQTPWTDPTAPVTVSSGKELLAGPVAPTSTVPIRSRNVRFTKPYDEPTAKVVVLDWDNELAANIPVETEVRRGTLANFTKETEYLRPTERMLVQKNHSYNTNLLVVDIDGGQPLPSRIRGEDLTAPGEVLVLEASGKLTVKNELRDLEQYQQNTFRPPDADQGRGMPGEGDYEYEEGGELYTPANEKI